MSYWPHLMAALVGAGLTIQVGMNATVRMTIGSPVLAAIVNFVVGLAALGYWASTRPRENTDLPPAVPISGRWVSTESANEVIELSPQGAVKVTTRGER